MGAKQWLGVTKCPFEMLCDPKRELYQAFGLGRSISKVWSTSSLTYYAEQKAAGRQLPQSFQDIEDDPHQMGGDFIIDKEGKILLLHCSKNPTDRPSVESLIQVIKDHNTKSGSQ